MEKAKSHIKCKCFWKLKEAGSTRFLSCILKRPPALGKEMYCTCPFSTWVVFNNAVNGTNSATSHFVLPSSSARIAEDFFSGLRFFFLLFLHEKHGPVQSYCNAFPRNSGSAVAMLFIATWQDSACSFSIHSLTPASRCAEKCVEPSSPPSALERPGNSSSQAGASSCGVSTTVQGLSLILFNLGFLLGRLASAEGAVFERANFE